MGLPAVCDAAGTKVGVEVKVVVGWGDGASVEEGSGGAGLSDVGAYTAEVGVEYCPHSEGVEPHPLISSDTTKTGERMRLTKASAAKIIPVRIRAAIALGWSFSGGFYRVIWFESLMPSNASSVTAPRVR